MTMESDVIDQIRIWESADEIHVGVTKRMDHVQCGDNRRRGYVTRKYGEDGFEIDLFYCHNCGESGYQKSITGVFAGLKRPTAPPVGVVQLPEDMVGLNHPDVPSSVKKWAGAHRIIDTPAGWSTELGRTILPVTTSDGALIGYQARKSPTADYSVPKYLTVSRPDTPLRMVVRPRESSDLSVDRHYVPILVWTEDWASAYQFREFVNVYASPLFGTNVVAENVLWADQKVAEWDTSLDTSFMAPGREPLHVVWLDNDVKAAHEAATYLARLLNAMGRRCYQCTSTVEPKKTPVATLTNFVEAWRTL